MPKTVPEESPLAESESQTSFVAPPDRDDDFSDESEPEEQKAQKHSLKDFTFIPGAQGMNNDTFVAGKPNPKKNQAPVEDVDTSKLGSVEQIREYLEKELGLDTFMQIYPVIKAFGDDILFSEKVPELK